MIRFIRTSLLACLAALLAVSFTAARADAQNPIREAGFVEQTLVGTGLDQPVGVAWLPDGRMLVAEKPGRVKLVAPGGTPPKQVLDISAQVNEYLDRGLLGIAVDGQFAAGNPYVYLLYTYDAAAPLDTDAPESSRLDRYTLSGDTLSNRTTILGTQSGGPCPPPSPTLDCLPSDADTHSIGTIRAASDGTLFVGAGDGAPYQNADALSFRSQNDNSLAGKVLHITRLGQGVTGHPYCQSETNLALACTKIFAKGFRNPFRFTIRPGLGDGLVLGDVGWSDREEIDLVRAGGNYGWPCREGDWQTPQFKNDPKCAAVYADPQLVEPIQGWDHNFGQAALGGPEHDGDASFPAHMRGRIYVGDYSAQRLFSLQLENGSWVRYPLHDAWNGTDLQQRGGDLVYADLFGGAIRRLTYAGSNQPPNAVPVAAKAGGPLVWNFSAAGSTDPDPGDWLTYEWRFGDGATATGSTVSHTYAARKTYTAQLVARDPGGLESVVTFSVDADNRPPKIDSVNVPATFRIGQDVPLQATASDPDGDTPIRLDWKVTLIHGQGAQSHPHILPDALGNDDVFTPRYDHDADSHYEVQLIATDTLGGRLTQDYTVLPQVARVTLASEPAGAPLNYDALTVTAPHSRDSTIGFRPQLEAPERFTLNGVEHTFSRWSDGGDRVHSIEVPSTPTTVTAIYTPSETRKPDTPVPPTPTPPVVPKPKPETTPPTRPKLSLSAEQRVRRDSRGRGTFSGTVRNLPRGGRVQVAVAVRAGKRCRWWVPKRRALTRTATSCTKPGGWTTAKVKATRFAVTLPGKWPRGSVLVRARAVGSNGKVLRR